MIMPKNKKIEEPEYVYEETGMEDRLKKARDKFKKSEKERKEYLDGWQRERADFANFKRDMQKYLEDARESTKEDIITSFIDVLDNIELMVRHVPKDVAKTDWYRGVEQVSKQFFNTLKDLGITEIEAKGHRFDPQYHEAVEGEGDKISKVIQKGYKMSAPQGRDLASKGGGGDKVIRPAKVKVSKK